MATDFQHILARLCTEEQLRADFVADTDQFIIDNKINTQTAQQLINLSKEELKFFSASLLNKRYDAAMEYIPATKFLLGKEAKKYFHSFARNLPPSGINKHLKDAVNFLIWFNQNEKANHLLKQMTAFELQLLNPSHNKLHFIRTDYNLPLIRAGIYSGKEILFKKSSRLLVFKKGKLFKNIPFL